MLNSLNKRLTEIKEVLKETDEKRRFVEQYH